MLSVILLMAGIAAVIVKANTAIIIADWIVYLFFGLSATGFIIQFITGIIAKRQYNKISKEVTNNFKNFRT